MLFAPPPPPPITIWIHGTMPEYIVPLVGHIPSTSMHNFFHRKIGLHHATTYEPKFQHHTIAQALSESDQDRFPFETLYIFGWSGKLDPRERLRAAHQLHGELKEMVNAYKHHYGTRPIIRLITHSHGGNVALNLARIANTDDYTIKDLIVLAVPVQHETELCIHSPIFATIYSLHSHWDLLQVADPQGLPSMWKACKDVVRAPAKKEAFKDMVTHFEHTDLFSKRHFEPHGNLVQAQIQFKRRNLFHIEFLFENFVQQLPAVLNKLAKHTDGTRLLSVNKQDLVVELGN